MMSDETTKHTPSHDLFIVIGDGDNAEWSKVGAAWANRDGKGFSISLKAVPINGARLVMRVFNERSDVSSRSATSGPAAPSSPSPQKPHQP